MLVRCCGSRGGGRLVAGGGSCAVAGVLGVVGGGSVLSGGVAGLVVGSFGLSVVGDRYRWWLGLSGWDLLGRVGG